MIIPNVCSVVKWEVEIMANLRYNQRMKSQMIKIVVLKKYNLRVWMRTTIRKIRLIKKISQVQLKIEDNNDCNIFLIYMLKNLGFYHYSTKI